MKMKLISINARSLNVNENTAEADRSGGVTINETGSVIYSAA
jgi:hypothetical protein